MKKLVFLMLAAVVAAGAATLTAGQTRKESPDIIAARHARDRASVWELQNIAERVGKESAEKKSFDAYLRLALVQTWLCEAIESHKDDKLFKKAAEDGVAAAEMAVQLNPKSSEAHQLLGDLLNQLIPHVYGGGMRYGQRASDEMDKAIALDPENAGAYVSKSISLYYTPDSFGGSKTKAIEMLKKAVEVSPAEDSAHIWLAVFNLDAGKKKDALDEILLARKINPDRAFTNYVFELVKAAK